MTDINQVDIKIQSLACELKRVIKKVHSLFNLFRKSPIKNEVLFLHDLRFPKWYTSKS